MNQRLKMNNQYGKPGKVLLVNHANLYNFEVKGHAESKKYLIIKVHIEVKTTYLNMHLETYCLKVHIESKNNLICVLNQKLSQCAC